MALVKALLTESKVTQVLLTRSILLVSIALRQSTTDETTYCFPPGMIRAHFSLFLFEAQLLSNMKIATKSDGIISHLYAKNQTQGRL